MDYERTPELHSTFYTGTKTKYDNLGQEVVCLPVKIEDKLRLIKELKVLRSILGHRLFTSWLYFSYFISFEEYQAIVPRALDRLNEL